MSVFFMKLTLRSSLRLRGRLTIFLLLNLLSLLVLQLLVLHLLHLLLLHHLLLWLLKELMWLSLHLLLQILNRNTWHPWSQVDIHVIKLLVYLDTATGQTHDTVVHELLNILLVLGRRVLHLELRLLVLRSSHHWSSDRMGNCLRTIVQILVIRLLFKLLVILKRLVFLI